MNIVEIAVSHGMDVGSNLESCPVPSKSRLSFTANQLSSKAGLVLSNVAVQILYQFYFVHPCFVLKSVCIMELAEHPYAGIIGRICSGLLSATKHTIFRECCSMFTMKRLWKSERSRSCRLTISRSVHKSDDFMAYIYEFFLAFVLSAPCLIPEDYIVVPSELMSTPSDRRGLHDVPSFSIDLLVWVE